MDHTSPVPVRPAVSVIPLRDGPQGLELFIQHRQGTMDFAPGAVVFPGGRCDPQDEAAGAGLSLPQDVLTEHLRCWSRLDAEAVDPRGLALTRVATGLRELAEETGLVADPRDLLPWDNWVTPEVSPKRFDVAFFVLPVPSDAPAQPRHSTTEATHSGWEPADRILADRAAGRLLLLTPTRVIVEELVALGDVRAVTRLRPVITGVRDDRAERRPRPGAPPDAGGGGSSPGTGWGRAPCTR